MRLKYIVISIIVIVFIFALGAEVHAQCPMCKIAAETNLANGGSEGKGLNKGILYMLSMPYILVSTIGFIWWKNNRKVKEE